MPLSLLSCNASKTGGGGLRLLMPWHFFSRGKQKLEPDPFCLPVLSSFLSELDEDKCQLFSQCKRSDLICYLSRPTSKMATAINICREKQKPVELLFDRNQREPETEICSLHALRELINYLIMWRILFNHKVQAHTSYTLVHKTSTFSSFYINNIVRLVKYTFPIFNIHDYIHFIPLTWKEMHSTYVKINVYFS